MALVLADRVQQTGTANTTVSFTLSGSVTGFQSFSVIGDTNTTYYSATDASGNWETGLGTYSTTGPTLTRTTIYQSSNSNAAVTFSSTVNVFVTYPSGRSVNLNESGNVSALGTVSSGTWQGSTIGVAYGGTGLTSPGTAGNVLTSNGTAWTSTAPAAGGTVIPAGTVILFYQAAAPTGFTQVTTQNNKALRVVSGTGGGTGGSVAFTTAFASGLSAGATTLSTSQIPSHTHTVLTNNCGSQPSLASAGTVGTTTTTGSTGGGGSHDHTIPSFAVQYIDIIIASKN